MEACGHTLMYEVHVLSASATEVSALRYTNTCPLASGLPWYVIAVHLGSAVQRRLPSSSVM